MKKFFIFSVLTTILHCGSIFAGDFTINCSFNGATGKPVVVKAVKAMDGRDMLYGEMSEDNLMLSITEYGTFRLFSKDASGNYQNRATSYVDISKFSLEKYFRAVGSISLEADISHDHISDVARAACW